MLDRHVIAIGHWRGTDRQTAVQCAWCKRWMSRGDEYAAKRGARVSHGICEDCADEAGFPAPDGWDPDGGRAA